MNILDGVTSTAAELNILDGVTATTAELNILDGVTSTAAELNILDGVTATAELNYVDVTTVGTAEASKALVLDVNKDIGTIRNLTIDGVFTDGNYTFDTNGNVSGLGTCWLWCYYIYQCYQASQVIYQLVVQIMNYGFI